MEMFGVDVSQFIFLSEWKAAILKFLEHNSISATLIDHHEIDVEEFKLHPHYRVSHIVDHHKPSRTFDTGVPHEIVTPLGSATTLLGQMLMGD